jgi:hypothetical protein
VPRDSLGRLAYLFFVAFFFAAFYLGGGAERSTLGFGIESPQSA